MVDNNGTTKKIEFPLAGFTGGKCGRVTDVKKRILSNRDACLLLLAANGPICRTSTLKTLLRAWRPLEGQLGGDVPSELNFGYLFNSCYGHTTDNVEGRRDMSRRPGRAPYAYFWSNKRGEVKISHAGFKRLAWLLRRLKDQGCVPESLQDFVNPLWSAEV
jgi:hypothetical protein